jgi:hypothetical protein
MELWITLFSTEKDCWYWVLGEVEIIGIFHPDPGSRTVFKMMYEGAD